MVMVIFAAINHYYGIITNKQAPSSDKLPAAIFKLACSGIFPDDWKVAKVLPKYKSNDRCDPSNYWPISILPIVLKIIEEIIFSQFYEYLEENNILSDH